jgi:hypothetical protein
MKKLSTSEMKYLTQARLQRRAQAAAGATPFSSESIKLLFDLIRQGVDKLEADGVLGDAARLLDAENAIDLFVTEMLRERGLDDYMGESTFDRVKNRFCPGFFPFC